MTRIKLKEEQALGRNEAYMEPKTWQKAGPFKAMHKYTRSQNLGQTYNGVPKYKTMAGDRCTGEGYGFEDLHMNAKVSEGHDMEKIPAFGNGADYIDNGEAVQLKFGRKGKNIAGKLYGSPKGDDSYGEYRYPGQRIVVPKGKKKYVEHSVRFRKNNGFTGYPESVEESPVSCEEVEAYTYRGKESFLIDARDPNLYVPAAHWGAAVGLAGYATAMMIAGVKCRKEGRKMNWKDHLKVACIGTLSFAASAAAFLAVGCADRQTLRPEKDRNTIQN